MMKLLMIAACGVIAVGPATAGAASDAPKDYTHVMPLTSGANQGVLQLRLPKDAYLHARTPLLDDVRVFDANGAAQPFALREPAVATRITRKDAPVRIFPLMGGGGVASQLDLDVSTAPDGRLLSVKVRPERQDGTAAASARLTALVLDLGKRDVTAPAVGALRFTLPPERRDYSAQVWLETSDDMKNWDTVGAAELNWLVNQDAQTLANDRLDFDARRFRYARLTWRSGTPLLFAAITAEQQIRADDAPPVEQLLLQARASDQPNELVYPVPVAIAPSKVGLQFSEPSIVLPAALGIYRAGPSRQGGAAARRFDPIVNTTFYRIDQGGQTRGSGDVDVAQVHAAQWVLRTAAPTSAKPALRLSWQPATLVFLASGNPPYTLAVGRERAEPAARPLSQVAPGFDEVELQKLQTVGVGPAVAQLGAAASDASAASEAADGARRRILVLWGVLLLGVGVLALMVWRLLRAQNRAP